MQAGVALIFIYHFNHLIVDLNISTLIIHWNIPKMPLDMTKPLLSKCQNFFKLKLDLRPVLINHELSR
jgi:hypothetical protein